MAIDVRGLQTVDFLSHGSSVQQEMRPSTLRLRLQLVSEAPFQPVARLIRKPKIRIGSEKYLGLDPFESLLNLNAPQLIGVTIPMTDRFRFTSATTLNGAVRRNPTAFNHVFRHVIKIE